MHCFIHNFTYQYYFLYGKSGDKHMRHFLCTTLVTCYMLADILDCFDAIGLVHLDPFYVHLSVPLECSLDPKLGEMDTIVKRVSV